MLSTVSEPPRVTASAATVDGSDVVLRDGSTVHLRLTDAGDVEGVAAFLRGLSPDASWFRFLGSGLRVDRAARELVERGTGLVAVAGPEETVVAHAMLHPRDARSRRARLCGRGRLAGSGHRHPAAGTPRSARRGEWHRDLRGVGASHQPTDASGVSRLGLPRQGAFRAGRTQDRAAVRAGAGGDRPLRGARPDRRRGRSAPRPRAFLDRGDRRLAAAGKRRRDGRPQSRGRRVRRTDLSDQPAREDHRRPASLRIHRRRPRTRGSGRHRRLRAACGGGRAGMRAQRCPRARGALGRLRRRRPGGRRAAGGAAGHLPGDGHAACRAQLPRRAQHGPCGADGRHVRAGSSAGGPHRVRLSERRLRHRRARPRRAQGPWAVVVRLDGQQG